MAICVSRLKESKAARASQMKLGKACRGSQIDTCMGESLDGLNGKTVQKGDRKNQGGRGRRCREGVAGKFGGKGGSKPAKGAWLIGSQCTLVLDVQCSHDSNPACSCAFLCPSFEAPSQTDWSSESQSTDAKFAAATNALHHSPSHRRCNAHAVSDRTVRVTNEEQAVLSE
jgi:hypothetical protein